MGPSRHNDTKSPCDGTARELGSHQSPPNPHHPWILLLLTSIAVRCCSTINIHSLHIGTPISLGSERLRLLLLLLRLLLQLLNRTTFSSSQDAAMCAKNTNNTPHPPLKKTIMRSSETLGTCDFVHRPRPAGQNTTIMTVITMCHSSVKRVLRCWYCSTILIALRVRLRR